jgi:hypothetical protein
MVITSLKKLKNLKQLHNTKLIQKHQHIIHLNQERKYLKMRKKRSLKRMILMKKKRRKKNLKMMKMKMEIQITSDLS